MGFNSGFKGLNCQTSAAGSTTVQAMNDRPFSAETWVQSQASPYEIFSWPLRQVFLRLPRFPLSATFHQYRFCFGIFALCGNGMRSRRFGQTCYLHLHNPNNSRDITYHSHTKRNDFKTCISERVHPVGRNAESRCLFSANFSPNSSSQVW